MYVGDLDVHEVGLGSNTAHVDVALGKRLATMIEMRGLRKAKAGIAITAVLAAGLPALSRSGPPVEPSLAVASQQAQRRVVWVALEGAHKIAKVNLSTHEVVVRRSVPGAPHNLTISPSGRTIATALWSAGSIVVRRNGPGLRTTALLV